MIVVALSSVMELGEKKGYKLICHAGNAFLLRNDLVDRLPDWDFSIENLWQSPDKLMELKEDLNMDSDVYLAAYHGGLGDSLQFSTLPEEFYKQQGKKNICMGRCYFS